MSVRLVPMVLCASTLTYAATIPASPTFYKNVLPVMQSRCQECHRPGEAAPMSFLTYKEVRPWAKAIREAVITRKMPPWPADPHFGKFSNDRSLSREEIDTLVAWADGGAQEGDPAEAPKAVHFVEGWGIHTPDAVFEMPNAFDVPASGTVDYQYIVIPSGFTEDKWVQESEARPGNRKLVHHIIAFIRPPGSNWLKDAKPGIPFVQVKDENNGKEKHRHRRDENSRRRPSCWWVSRRERRREFCRPAKPNWCRPDPISFSRCITRPTGRRERIEAASVSCSPKGSRRNGY